MKYQTKEETEPEARLSPKLSRLGLGTTVISGVSCKQQASPISAQACLFWQLKLVNFEMYGHVALRFHVMLTLLASQPIILVLKTRACMNWEHRGLSSVFTKREAVCINCRHSLHWAWTKRKF